MFGKKFWGGVALSALSVAVSGPAHAQSTGSQEFENEIIVTGQRSSSVDGVIRAETAPKAIVSISSEYLETQVPGQTFLNSIAILPGVNFSNNDAYGSSGGEVSLRGLDSARVSLTIDGIPLNDSGNYAVYSNQMPDSEILERVSVNLGATDVDSPTAAASGGTINTSVRKPSETFGAVAQYGYGDNDFNRAFLMLDTGAVGPIGTRAFIAASNTEYDHFNNPGGVDKKQVNARIYQPIGSDGDFVAISFHYNENRNNFLRNYSVAQFKAVGLANYQPNGTTCAPQLRNTGVADTVARSCANFFGLATNPSNTGNIRIQSRFGLTDNLTLTIDPSFQYVLANGGSTRTMNEVNPNLVSGGTANFSADLNGDGDFLDSNVTVFRPNTTNTRRYGVTGSLIYNMSDSHRLRFAYAWDRANHRQTGETTFILDNGHPDSVFAGKDGWGRRIATTDGSHLRRRDRLSIASLNQISAEYRGDFFNDGMTLVAGVRAPFFKRELNNFCWQLVGGDPLCTNNTPTFTNPANWIAPFRGQEVEYDAILPNLGVTFRPGDAHQIYMSYAENLSAPRTDDLYGVRLNALKNVQPETTQNFDIGYRMARSDVILSLNGWFKKFDGRIERAYDQDTGDTLSMNIGQVDQWGFDGQIGIRPTEAFSSVFSASWQDSELKNDIQTGLSGGLPVYAGVRGKSLWNAPDWMFTGRVSYDFGDVDVGAQAIYKGKRFTNLTNTETAPDYVTVDADIRWDFGRLIGRENTYLQLNAVNLFDQDYLSNISIPFTFNGTANAQVGAPRTFMATVRASF